MYPTDLGRLGIVRVSIATNVDDCTWELDKVSKIHSFKSSQVVILKL